MFRTATADDAQAIAGLINEAFLVEAFFKIGDRTSAAEILQLMREGEFIVLEDDAVSVSSPWMAGCVYLTCHGDRAYFGMLSIDPARQRKGFGRRLIDAAEARARHRGCRFMDIHIVNLREDLTPYYRSLGYTETGTLPFSQPERASQPCHFIVMSKELRGGAVRTLA